jgi:hypothetical protein
MLGKLLELVNISTGSIRHLGLLVGYLRLADIVALGVAVPAPLCGRAVHDARRATLPLIR